MLNGLFINYDVNIGAWFGGLIGLWIVQYALACFILWVGLHMCDRGVTMANGIRFIP